MMVLSIKYWKLRQLESYMKMHFESINSMIIHFLVAKKELKWRGKKQSKSKTILCNMIYFHSRIAVKSHKEGLKWPDGYESALDLNLYKSCKSEMRVRDLYIVYRQDMICGFVDCMKPQSDFAERFKMCGGCKLVHYCSRLCQKRAWIQHKQHCNELLSRYAL